jgi:hypothetical protein
MGGVVSFFFAIVHFFELAMVMAETIGELLPQFLANPLMLFLKLILIIVCGLVGFVVLVLYMLISVVITPIAYVLGFCWGTMFCVYATVLAIALWLVYALVTLMIYTGDYFTGGWLFSLFLCEDDLEAWAIRGNYAAGNRCVRSMMCVLPCGERYTPFLGGTMCLRNPEYVPSLCPQQHVYQTFVNNIDPDYGAVLEGKRAKSGPVMFADKISPDPTFRVQSLAGKQRYLKKAYKNKIQFLTKCYEGMKPYDALTRYLCANAKLLLPPGADRDAVISACTQTYCQYRYVPKTEQPSSSKLRESGERETFCADYGDDHYAAPAYEDQNELMRRILFWLVTVVVLYMIVLSLQRVYQAARA